MVYYQPRSTWTTSSPGFPRYSGRRFNKKDVRGVVLHYPGDGNITRGVLSQAQEAGLFRAYRNYHVGSRGWADIGYNIGIGQSGRVTILAGLTHASAHAASNAYPRANHEWVGILLLLGNNEEPSAAMIRSVNDVLRDLRGAQGFSGMSQCVGHQQVYGASTACPGPKVMAHVRRGSFTFKAPSPSAPSNPSPSKLLRTYTVKRGDTLGAIAKRYGTSVKALQFLNGIRNPDRIDVGQELYLAWVVSRGQTLGSIAVAYGTTVNALVKLNGIQNPNRIEVGQLIRLP